jgi:hypothetical protein
MIYELRLYSVAQGRMADVQSRFQHHLPALFKRHGVNCLGHWAATSGPRAPQFVYLLAYQDYAEREACWASFYADAEWWRVRAETNAGCEMIERFDLFFLKPNPAWQSSGKMPADGSMHELLLQETALGQTGPVNEFIAKDYLPLLREAGARISAVLDMASGADLPKVAFFLAWDDASARERGWRSIEDHGQLRGHFKRQREQIGGPLFVRGDSYLLSPGSPSA